MSTKVAKVSKQVLQISGVRAPRQRDGKCPKVGWGLGLTRDSQEARLAEAE